MRVGKASGDVLRDRPLESDVALLGTAEAVVLRTELGRPPLDHEQVGGFVIGACDQLTGPLDQLVSSGSEDGEPVMITGEHGLHDHFGDHVLEAGPASLSTDLVGGIWALGVEVFTDGAGDLQVP
jgi:hypothetical protein